MFPPIIVTVILVSPVILNTLSGAIIASNSLKTVVIGKNSDHELSLKEKFCIDLIACTVLYVATSFPVERFTSWIKSLQMNQLNINAFLSIYILFIAFGVSFVVIVQLIIPFRHLKKLFEFYHQKVGKVWNRWIDFFSEKYENPNIYAYNSRKAIDRFKIASGLEKIMRLIVIAGAFILDIIIGFFRFLFSVIICFFLQALLIFAALVGKLLLCIINFITSVPGRKVMKDTFRLSAIIAVLVVVIINRLSIITEVDEEFVGISEFVASAIVIPIIFEWIYSGKKQNGNKNSSNS